MPGEGFLAACVQMRCGEEKRSNLERAVALVSEAAGRGARLVVLPEMFFWRGPPERQQAAAEPLDGPTLARMADLARELRIVLVAGSILGLQQFGFGLAVAIALDVTVVRMLLVPSAMALFGRWNWWLPPKVARLVRVRPSPLAAKRPVISVRTIAFRCSPPRCCWSLRSPRA